MVVLSIRSSVRWLVECCVATANECSATQGFRCRDAREDDHVLTLRVSDQTNDAENGNDAWRQELITSDHVIFSRSDFVIRKRPKRYGTYVEQRFFNNQVSNYVVMLSRKSSARKIFFRGKWRARRD